MLIYTCQSSYVVLLGQFATLHLHQILGGTIERVSLILSDTVVLVVTVRRTYGTVKASRQAGVSAPLSIVMFREGQSDST